MVAMMTTERWRGWSMVTVLLSIAVRWAQGQGQQSSLSSPSSAGEIANSCDDNLLSSIVVSTTEQASDLRTELLRCSGATFNVEWRSNITIAQPLGLFNRTSLTIKGSGDHSSVVDGGREVPLFVVNGSSFLHLEDLSLTGGDGSSGGVVAARDGASVSLINCDVYLNKVSSNGGAIYLQGASLEAAGVNFTANSAEVLGGVIFAHEKSTVTTRDGTQNNFEENEAKLGGAIYLEEESNVTFGSGKHSLSKNYAAIRGGAIYAENTCRVKGVGTTSFAGNTAGNNGGAIFALNGSTVMMTGNTSFINNTSDNYGGAIMATIDVGVRTRGDTIFMDNYAKNDGGAVQLDYGSSVRMTGRTMFDGNAAGRYGGAINAFDGVSVVWAGEMEFITNVADYGGAVYASRDAVASFSGTQYFENNTALSDGGALHLTSALVLIAGEATFIANTARGGSGGGIYCGSVARLTISDAVFVGNSAVWGGAVATFSSGGQASSSTSDSSSSGSGESSGSEASSSGVDAASDTNAGAPAATDSGTGSGSSASTLDPSLTVSASSSEEGGIGGGSGFGSGSSSSTSTMNTPVKFRGCLFERNFASEDGGGLYTVAGYDIIRDSNFTSNRAASSGGGLVHAGVLEEVSNTIFEGNGAGNEGPAILSLGLLRSMTGVTFEGNEFYCEAGKFSTEDVTADDSCRFETVCSRCAIECGSDLEIESTITNTSLTPTCDACPSGSDTSRRGGKLKTLEIQPGYFRSSLTSLDIRECFHEDACPGGIVLSEYCAPGYTGPYCAVCANGYAQGYAHTCKSCMGGSRDSAVGITAAILGAVMVLLTLAIVRLVSIVETEREAEGKAQSRWQQKCSSLHECMRKTFPLTAVKIVVVVWQIVTQYSDVAGVQYPGAYKDFLAVIDVVNLDLGFILTFACIYDTNFYDRLLIATLGPIVVLMVLGGTYLIARRRNRHSEEAIATVKRRHLSVALFVLFVVYATVSYTIFETFVCDTLDDGQSYLRADFSIQCDTERHTLYEVYASLMLVAFPIGFPCGFGWWLFKYRNELVEEERELNADLRPLVDLWEPYKREKYYYEVVECFRRIALTGFAVFIYHDSSAQIAIVLMLAAVFMVISEIMAPFAKSLEMWLYRAGHYVVFASMYLALLLRVDVSGEREQSQDVFAGVIVIAHAAMLIVVIGQGLLVFLGWEELVETPGALKGMDRSAHEDETSRGDLYNHSVNRALGAASRENEHTRGVKRNTRELGADSSGSGSGKRAGRAPAWEGRGSSIGGSGGVAIGGTAAERTLSAETQGGARPIAGGSGKEGCEEWEHPAPTAKSSFFPSPLSSSNKIVLAASFAHEKTSGDAGLEESSRRRTFDGRVYGDGAATLTAAAAAEPAMKARSCLPPSGARETPTGSDATSATGAEEAKHSLLRGIGATSSEIGWTSPTRRNSDRYNVADDHIAGASNAASRSNSWTSTLTGTGARTAASNDAYSRGNSYLSTVSVAEGKVSGGGGSGDSSLPSSPALSSRRRTTIARRVRSLSPARWFADSPRTDSRLSSPPFVSSQVVAGAAVVTRRRRFMRAPERGLINVGNSRDTTGGGVGAVRKSSSAGINPALSASGIRLFGSSDTRGRAPTATSEGRAASTVRMDGPRSKPAETVGAEGRKHRQWAAAAVAELKQDSSDEESPPPRSVERTGMMRTYASESETTDVRRERSTGVEERTTRHASANAVTSAAAVESWTTSAAERRNLSPGRTGASGPHTSTSAGEGECMSAGSPRDTDMTVSHADMDGTERNLPPRKTTLTPATAAATAAATTPKREKKLWRPPARSASTGDDRVAGASAHTGLQPTSATGPSTSTVTTKGRGVYTVSAAATAKKKRAKHLKNSASTGDDPWSEFVRRKAANRTPDGVVLSPVTPKTAGRAMIGRSRSPASGAAGNEAPEQGRLHKARHPIAPGDEDGW